MLRVALLIGLLTACGGSAKGLTWPKASGDGPDGGESLAPKPGSVAISAAADEDDIVDDKPVEKLTAKVDDKPTESPRPTVPTVTAPDDIINTEDLVIEIDD